MGFVEKLRAPLDHRWSKIQIFFRTWLNRPLQDDLSKDVRLSGFSVEDPRAMVRDWDVIFETIGSKWLAPTVPFVGDQPKDPVVDT